MKTEQEIKDKIISLYEAFVQSFANQFDGADYSIKDQIRILKWVLEDGE